MSAPRMRCHVAPDGTPWGIAVRSPTHSNAMVMFLHPDGGTARRNRYAWYNAEVPQAHDPLARLEPSQVLDGLTDGDLARLFRRSMPIESARPSYVVS